MTPVEEIREAFRVLEREGGRELIWAAILAERARQIEKWSAPHDHGQGDCSSPNVTDMVKAVVLGEECGEVMRAVLERDDQQLRTELVQVAAICTAWLELLGVAE